MTEGEVREILRLDAEHNRRLRAPYNPLTGEGSPIERVRLDFDDSSYVLIPAYMACTPTVRAMLDAGGVARYAARLGVPEADLRAAVHKLRVHYDFEFWAATCAKIFDKSTGRLVPFVLRKAQLKLVAVLSGDLFAGIPVRIVLLKARQWGGSTVVQLFMAWIQLFHRTHWNSAIVSDVESQALTIRAMYSKMARHHPGEICPVRFRNFEGSAKNKELLDRDCVVSIGSMQKPDSLRSGDIKMAHLSEVGLWKSTKERKPEDVIQTIIGSVPREPFTVVVLESTAKGIGNFFHGAWCDATDGRSAYRPVFVAWFEIDLYYKPFADEAQKRTFAASLNRDELARFYAGATLEGLNWYREKRTEYSTDWQMLCEFPSTPEEAFQSSGRPAHDPLYVRQQRPFVRPPAFVGEIAADALYGPDALRDVHFMATPAGDLWIWKMPDRERRIADRYVVSLDIGGRNPRADYSVISVLDRAPLLLGGVEEAVATYRFHLDQDLTVWRAVQVAEFYNHALFAPEANSLDRKGQEGDHSLTILDEIKEHYDNIFARNDPARIREGEPLRLGFITTQASKTDLVNQYNKRLREVLYIERDKRALDEIEWYEVKPDGSYGAVEGRHDDIYMSRAIALKVSQLMDLPREVNEKPPRTESGGTVRTEASM